MHAAYMHAAYMHEADMVAVGDTEVEGAVLHVVNTLEHIRHQLSLVPLSWLDVRGGFAQLLHADV
jgi:hypothetical protein